MNNDIDKINLTFMLILQKLYYICIVINVATMSQAKLEVIEQSELVSLYSIKFNGEDVTEFEKFLQKFKDNAELNEDFQRIVYALSKILDRGALERYFRPEGRMNDNVCAVPIESGKLRLYCLRMSDQILIVGNGGVKSTRTYNEDPILSGYVLDLQKFEKLINAGIKDGSISVQEKEFTQRELSTFNSFNSKQVGTLHAVSINCCTL